MEIKEEDKRKQLKIIEETYDMYERNKKETERNMKKKLNPDGTKRFTEEDIKEEMELLSAAQSELFAKYSYFGGNPDDLAKRKTTSKKSSKKNSPIVQDEVVDNEVKGASAYHYDEPVPINEAKKKKIDSTPIMSSPVNNSSQSAYDVIPIPSNGECYPEKMSRIAVAYLTAYDENMIIAPNLYRDNKFIDVMLKNKILTDTIDPGDLIEGDRDAIILFLRMGYGNNYPISVTDNVTGTEFDTVVDLSKLKFKEFKLKGDENGWFDFELPMSKKMVKFKFLTHNDLETLNRLEENEEKRLKKNKLREFVETMDEYIENDDEIENQQKIKVRQAIRAIEAWESDMDERDALDYTHSVTNKLEMSIMAYDGITDRRMIHEFVKNMSVKDSSALRKYILANEPGIDYNITIEKPESLGGGSMTAFLQLDQFVFLNLAE